MDDQSDEFLNEVFNPFIHIKEVSVDRLSVESLPTGFAFLDEHMVLKKGRPELVVIGAGTSQGKSSLMVQIAANVAANAGHVFFYSLEMDERDIKARLLSPRIGAPLWKIMKGLINETTLKKANTEFDNINLHICTDGRKDISHIKRTAFDLSRRHPPALIVVDYLQLVRGGGKGVRTEEIGFIMGELKSLAVELKCPILMGSQVGRAVQYRGKQGEREDGTGDYRPLLADLSESKSIEQDADVVVFIVRQSVYDGTRQGEADFYIAKNRSNALGHTVVNFNGPFLTFEEKTGI